MQLTEQEIAEQLEDMMSKLFVESLTIAKLRDQIKALEDAREIYLKTCYNYGIPQPQLAKITGLSRQRVAQIISK